MGEVLNKPPVEISKSDELLYFPFRLRSWPLCYPIDFYRVHFHLSFRDDESEIFNPGAFELALVRSEVEFVFPEDVEDFSEYLAMFCKVLSED